IAGPVAEDSTGTTLVRCGGKTWAIFGSADRACYVRTYPDLEPVGHLSFDHPPWPAGKSDNWAEGRVWPAFAETPGGAIHASGGSLDIFGSRFTNNFFSATADNVWFDGAALYASAVALTIADTVFDGNTLSDTIKPCQGAALFLTGGNAFIDGCTFTTNTLYGNHNGNDHTGAAIHATGVTGLTVRDSYFAGNVSKCNTQKSGGLVRLSGATEATTMRLERCVFKANGPTDDNLGMCASIGLNAGILEMEHCLFAELSLPRSGSFKRAIDIQKGTLRASKCSFVNNDAAGIFCHAEQGHVVLTDSIVYGNTQGDLVNFNTDGSNFKVSHCCLGTDYGYGWTGIFTDDPLLSDDGFYHPLSAAGRLADGYLAGSTWTTDAASSPTLDAGDPAADWFDEPQPNNLRMNLGYDANTPAASKSATGAYVAFDSLAVVALAATNVTDSSAWARGIVGGLGNGGDASVTLVWDTADRSTDTAAWAHVVPLGTFGQWGHIASQITGLTGGMTCHYRLVASNASGTAWSDDASFAIPVAPTLALSGISHLSRHSARVCATLVDDGAADCETVVTYWKEAAPSATLSVTLDARQLPEGVLTRIPLGGLTAGTCYGFRVEVSNPA
ncbi:MAG: right-handed parallel beta-helix repeat-containing protein, partial [Planctomycetes bacterium]|nr:right-handed parallel beta-helix repeat-containing protein [Planctomycetota bacterium]